MNLPDKLTDKQIIEICFNYRHDFGLDKIEGSFSSGMTEKEREELKLHVKYMYEAIKPVLEVC